MKIHSFDNKEYYKKSEVLNYLVISKKAQMIQIKSYLTRIELLKNQLVIEKKNNIQLQEKIKTLKNRMKELITIRFN